ncbi:MAG: anti-sigma factor [Ramlibacter sp.]|nr:anti-sigma factor [Ramlibacter sp.]
MNPTFPSPPVTEADLQAFVDEQLPAERLREVEAYLGQRPEEARRVQDYRAHKRELHALFSPVLDEPLPQRLKVAARRQTPWYLQRMPAGVAIAVISGAAGWGLRGEATIGNSQLARTAPPAITMASASGFAQRAAVAHAVYSPDQRRAVEVDAAHEEQLVAWLSKRIGAPMKPPHLQPLGYTLDGGRLLPGGEGPVAQFMYHDSAGAKLTLYVSREISETGNTTQDGKNKDTSFRFAREGGVNVFYWVDGPFGYAISADADKAELARVSAEVYQQLARR